jgi:hypothetical protein
MASSKRPTVRERLAIECDMNFSEALMWMFDGREVYRMSRAPRKLRIDGGNILARGPSGDWPVAQQVDDADILATDWRLVWRAK